jgi:AraC-like DNA-binding protein
MYAQVAGTYREWAPVAALRGHVRCLWVNDFSDPSPGSFQVVPDGCVDLIWTRAGLRVAGPDTRPVVEESPSSGLYVGIRFHPGAAFSWLGVPLAEFLNARVPLTEFWGDAAVRVADELSKAGDAAATARGLERALLARLQQVGPPDGGIAFLRRAACEKCDGGRLGIAGIAGQTGWSERTLRRRSRDAFGYGLQTLGRIMRFQRFFSLAMRSADYRLVDLAMLAGFADQAHLSREVQRLGGTTAGQFFAQAALLNGRSVQDNGLPAVIDVSMSSSTDS